MTFINTIISYLTKNGMIDKIILFQFPFRDMNDQGIFDDADAGKVIRTIEEINGNAGGALNIISILVKEIN